MKKFKFNEVFYDSIKGMTNKQKGEFLEILCQYYFGNEGYVLIGDDLDKQVLTASYNAIRYNMEHDKDSNNSKNK